jgi:Flp pilus assembly protein TadG
MTGHVHLRAPRPCRSFRHDRRGLAAVEFALVSTFILLPLMLGLIQIMSLFRVDTKLAAFTENTAQMVSVQQTSTAGVSTINATGSPGPSLQDICQGAAQALAPIPASGLTVNIAGVTLESGPTGTAHTTVNSTTAAYNIWEQDFTVTGTTCTAGTTKNIGTTGAVDYATSNPPSLTGATGTSGLVEVPCDNAIIVQATMNYPGVIKYVHGPLTQLASMRWLPATVSTELECPGCTLSQVQGTQLCNSSNTGN